jgi:hypothetical protein
MSSEGVWGVVTFQSISLMYLEYDDHVRRPLTDQYMFSLGEEDGDDHRLFPLVISKDGDYSPLHPGNMVTIICSSGQRYP